MGRLNLYVVLVYLLTCHVKSYLGSLLGYDPENAKKKLEDAKTINLGFTFTTGTGTSTSFYVEKEHRESSTRRTDMTTRTEARITESKSVPTNLTVKSTERITTPTFNPFKGLKLTHTAPESNSSYTSFYERTTVSFWTANYVFKSVW